MIDATGGTGGGLFRYMYARFVDEAADIIGSAVLGEIGARLRAAGDRWRDVATLFDEASDDVEPAKPLAEIPSILHIIADLEEAIWHDLLVASRP